VEARRSPDAVSKCPALPNKAAGTSRTAKNLPSVAMRELVMPEAGPYDADADHISIFYYKKRGILFLFIGFVLQMIGDLVG
jgi:hypothetical protein